MVSETGAQKLHRWWGLSYAAFLTMPRSLMQEMPDEWQGKMADLLDEYYEVYANLPSIGSRVNATQNGKLIKMPEWANNYRHPDRQIIQSFMATTGTHSQS